MKASRRILLLLLLVPVLAVAGYVGYLWATYIDETVQTGSAYGFTIGATQEQTLASVSLLRGYPKAVVYVSFGQRAGDNFTVEPSSSQLDRLRPHEQWEVLLGGTDQFFDSIRLTFRKGQLIEIYRHRKHFEFP